MSYPVEVTLVDVNTGKETVLHKKKKSNGEYSRCFFMESFTYNNYEIQLRLDYNWKPDEDPTLDLDTTDVTTGKVIKTETGHHTKKTYDPKSKRFIYDFNFGTLHLRLYTRGTFEKTLTIGADIE